MATEKQIAASRANGSKSRGPVTAQGKQNSRRSKSRHHLLIHSVVLDTEVSERFSHLLDTLRKELNPRSFIEDIFIEKMAVAQWRQARLWQMEKFSLVDEVSKQDPDMSRANPPARDAAALRSANTVLNQYEMRFDRQFAASLDRFYKFRQRSQQVLGNKEFLQNIKPELNPSEPALNQS
jgi:hypothetical protein